MPTSGMLCVVTEGTSRLGCAIWMRQARKSLHSHAGGHLKMALGLCRQSKDDLIGSRDEEGETGSFCAAAEKHGLHKVGWLHSQGNSIHQANHCRRTPFMEAALWLWLSTVRYLYEQGVGPQASDGNGMRVLDLMDELARNTNERQVRCEVYRKGPDAALHADRSRVF